MRTACKRSKELDKAPKATGCAFVFCMSTLEYPTSPSGRASTFALNRAARQEQHQQQISMALAMKTSAPQLRRTLAAPRTIPSSLRPLPAKVIAPSQHSQ
jgi:hypothetical protein